MIYAHVITDQRLFARLRGLWGQTRVEVTRAIWRLTLRLQRKVKEEKLSGQVLHVRTGTLRRSINAQVFDKGSSIYGVVGTNVKYAPPHEFGFSGSQQVKAHLRMMKTAWGHPVRNPRKIMVNAHQRQVNLPERSFLRSALAEMGPEIKLELEGAVNLAIRNSQ